MKKLTLKLKNVDIDGMTALDAKQMKEVLGGLSWSSTGEITLAPTTYQSCAERTTCTGDCQKGSTDIGSCSWSGGEASVCYCY